MKATKAVECQKCGKCIDEKVINVHHCSQNTQYEELKNRLEEFFNDITVEKRLDGNMAWTPIINYDDIDFDAIMQLISTYDEVCQRCGNSKYERTPEDMLPSVIDAIEFRRDQYGWTKTQMAKELGWSKEHYSDFIHGRWQLPYYVVCNAFRIGVPPVVLLQTTQFNTGNSKS